MIVLTGGGEILLKTESSELVDIRRHPKIVSGKQCQKQQSDA